MCGTVSYLVTPLFVSIINDSVLLFSPRRLFDVWIQMVVPALTALLANSSLQVFGNQCPTLRPVLLDQLDNVFVFFFGPGTCFRRKLDG